MLTVYIILLVLAIAGLFITGRSIDQTTRHIRDLIETYLNTTR